jgi:hypothetical protein
LRKILKDVKINGSQFERQRSSINSPVAQW